MAATQAWPFLVARGRDRGYSVLLAPDVLVADGDYGFLEEQAVPSHTDAVHVADGRSMRGRRVCLVWTEQMVSAADVGTGETPRDAHSRPLRLLLGFLCMGPTVATPAAADLDAARSAALSTYRRFLADEDRFTAESSAPFPMRSTLTAATAVRGEAAPGRKRFTAPAVFAAVAVAAAVVVAVLMAWPSQPSREPLPPCGTSVAPTPSTAPTNCTITTASNRRTQ